MMRAKCKGAVWPKLRNPAEKRSFHFAAAGIFFNSIPAEFHKIFLCLLSAQEIPFFRDP